MKTIQDEVDKLRDRLILRVDQALDGTPEGEAAFINWSLAFKSYAVDTLERFAELQPHVKWPV